MNQPPPPPPLPEESNTNVGQRFIKGAAWMLIAKLAERGLGLISTLILARLLWPEDFGLVAMAAPVVALVELLGAWGIDSALVNRRDLTRQHLDTAFTLNLIISGTIALVLWLLAPMAAHYFHEPRLEAVIAWLALGNLIQGLGNPGFVMFRKNINMVPEVVLLLAKKISSLLIAAITAIILGNYWALVWGTLISRVVGVVVSHAMTSYRPRLSLSERHSILGFSAWMLVVQLLYYLQLRANDLIIGRLLGTTHLAHFNVAIDLASSATGEAIVSISRAAFPAFVKLNTDAQRLSDGLGKVLSGVSIFAFPAALGIAATNELLVGVLLGSRWMPVADLLPALAISSAVLGVVGQLSYVYMALGHPRAAALVAACSVSVLIVISLFLVPSYGLGAINVAYPSMAASAAVGHFVMLRKMLPEFRSIDWLAFIWRPLLSASAMLIIVKFIGNGLSPITQSSEGILPLVLLVMLGVFAYVAFLLALWCAAGTPEGIEAIAWRKIRSLLIRPKDGE